MSHHRHHRRVTTGPYSLPVRGRFVLWRVDDGMLVVDARPSAGGACVEFASGRQARQYAAFLRDLLRSGIDVDLHRAPIGLDYRYDSLLRMLVPT